MSFDLPNLSSIFHPSLKRKNSNNNVDDFFSNFKQDFPYSLLTKMGNDSFPQLDVSETNSYYCFEFDLPGVDKKDVEVKVDNNILIIKGIKTEESDKKDTNFHTRERFYGEFQRSISLPTGIDPNKIEANFKDGVLVIKIAKNSISSSKTINISD